MGDDKDALLAMTLTASINSLNDRRFKVVLYGIDECPINTNLSLKDFDLSSVNWVSLLILEPLWTVVDLENSKHN